MQYIKDNYYGENKVKNRDEVLKQFLKYVDVKLLHLNIALEGRDFQVGGAPCANALMKRQAWNTLGEAGRQHGW